MLPKVLIWLKNRHLIKGVYVDALAEENSEVSPSADRVSVNRPDSRECPDLAEEGLNFAQASECSFPKLNDTRPICRAALRVNCHRRHLSLFSQDLSRFNLLNQCVPVLF